MWASTPGPGCRRPAPRGLGGHLLRKAGQSGAGPETSETTWLPATNCWVLRSLPASQPAPPMLPLSCGWQPL